MLRNQDAPRDLLAGWGNSFMQQQRPLSSFELQQEIQKGVSSSLEWALPMQEEKIRGYIEDMLPVVVKKEIGRRKLPKNLYIRTLHNKQLRLKTPISVCLENDGHQDIAYAPDLDIYGYGDSEYEALENLRTSIVEFYFDLKKEKLGPSLKKIWDYLKTITTEK